MASIFNSLNVGYSGLSVAQSAINTTSHNISNANTPGYSKQRITQQAQAPMHNIPGDVGNGVFVDTITRVHDEYTFSRYRGSQSSLEFTSYQQKTLEEVSDYFPDLEDLGIAKDLQDFFSSWSDLSKDPNSSAQKVVLVNNTQKLTNTLNGTSQKLESLQDRLNDEFKDGITEVNKLAREIVEINKNINKVENTRQGNANDLRDQRDQVELKLNKLLNISVFKGQLDSGIKQRTDMGNSYNINIAGFNIVDGTTFHPIDIETNNRFNSASYTSHDSHKIDFTSKIRGGKLGAIVELRGDKLDAQGRSLNSKIQNYIDDINSLSKGLIQKTNSIYASSAKEKMQSSAYEINHDTKLAEVSDINQGDFNIVVYNNQGEVVSKRAITIDENTTLNDGTANSIVSKINADNDDNNDNDATNDLDDIYEAKMINNTFVLEQKSGVSGYYVAIEDNNTNFAGYSGLSKIFEGSSAKDISVINEIKNDPSSLQSFKPPVDGNNDLANDMIALQYEAITFKRENGTQNTQTLGEFYRFTVSNIATDATNAKISNDATQSLDKTINERLQASSGVDMDEELMNLMKYQAAYQASAKIITTVDQMLNTLLSIKQ